MITLPSKKSEIRDQDVAITLYYISGYSKNSGKKEIKNLLEHGDLVNILVEKFGLFNRGIARRLKYIFQLYDTEEELDFATRVYEEKIEHLDLAGKDAILMGIDKIRSNIEFNSLLDEIV